ncbi:hypothetical protein BpHYR1_003396 [Brachionus plicatilis]|uniref:Uncharacterized protein n=1 Tax=Brachionus plicatilis TaxID=10195 RepID=A0A3M7QHZ3_BRAPC|nr:hypothetical protein BpHYR1_003396 [Brachionus plicatilis]
MLRLRLFIDQIEKYLNNQLMMQLSIAEILTEDMLKIHQLQIQAKIPSGRLRTIGKQKPFPNSFSILYMTRLTESTNPRIIDFAST